MNTKILMTVSSLLPGLAGTAALFAPHEVLTALHAPTTDPLPVVVQLMGALYLALAFTNWTAKDSLIGGIYGRPVSLGNFAHYAIGTLTLADYQFSAPLNTPLLILLAVYAIFALIFGWLVFVSSGIAKEPA